MDFKVVCKTILNKKVSFEEKECLAFEIIAFRSLGVTTYRLALDKIRILNKTLNAVEIQPRNSIYLTLHETNRRTKKQDRIAVDNFLDKQEEIIEKFNATTKFHLVPEEWNRVYENMKKQLEG